MRVVIFTINLLILTGNIILSSGTSVESRSAACQELCRRGSRGNCTSASSCDVQTQQCRGLGLVQFFGESEQVVVVLGNGIEYVNPAPVSCVYAVSWVRENPETVLGQRRSLEGADESLTSHSTNHRNQRLRAHYQHASVSNFLSTALPTPRSPLQFPVSHGIITGWTTMAEREQLAHNICMRVLDTVIPDLLRFPNLVVSSSSSPVMFEIRNALARLTRNGKDKQVLRRRFLKCHVSWQLGFDKMMSVFANLGSDPKSNPFLVNNEHVTFLLTHLDLLKRAFIPLIEDLYSDVLPLRCMFNASAYVEKESVHAVYARCSPYVNYQTMCLSKHGFGRNPSKLGCEREIQKLFVQTLENPMKSKEPPSLTAIGDRLILSIDEMDDTVKFPSFVGATESHLLVVKEIEKYLFFFLGNSAAHELYPHFFKNTCERHAEPIAEYFYKLNRSGLAEIVLLSRHKQLILSLIRRCAEYTSSYTRNQRVSNYLMNWSKNGDSLLRSLLIPRTVIWLNQDHSPIDRARHLLNQLDHLTKIRLHDPSLFEIRFNGYSTVGQGPIKQVVTEFFTTITDVEQISDTSLQLFVYTDVNNKKYIKPNHAKSSPEDMRNYRKIGQLIGIAYYLGIAIPMNLSASVCNLLRHPFSDLSPESAIDRMSKEDRTKFDFVSAVSIPRKDLDGLDFLSWTNANRVVDEFTDVAEFLQDQAMYDTVEVIRPAVSAMLDGISQVIKFGELSYLSLEDLVSRFASDHTINLDDLQRSTTYHFGPEVPFEFRSEKNHQTIRWFWEIMEEFSQKELSKLLYFVSSSPHPPPQGFTGYDKTAHWLQIAVVPWELRDPVTGETVDQPMKSATCFNKLKLPDYSSKEKMKEIMLNCLEVQFMDNK